MNNNTKHRRRENHKAAQQHKPLPYPYNETRLSPQGYTMFETKRCGKVAASGKV